MKSKNFRASGFLALLISLSLVVAACAGGAPADSGSASQSEASQPASGGEQAAAPTDVIELQLMGWASSEAENTRLQEMIDNFNSANPDIKVTLNQVPDYDTKLQTSLAGGTPPDVFYVDSWKMPDLVNAGALLPIGDKLENADDFFPSLKQAFTIDGTFYCPPKDFSTLALQYNTALFDAAGVDYPTPDWTWQDLAAATEKLTNADSGVVGAALNPDFARWIAFMYAAGGSITDEGMTQMTVNSPENLEAITFLSDMIAKGHAAQSSDLDSGWTGEAFGKQKAAMTFEGNWIVPFLKDQFPDVKYGVTELPQGPKGKATMAFTVCYAVPAAAKNADASIKLVNYLTGPDGMKAWTDLGLAMPTRASLSEGWLTQFPDLKPFLDGAEYARKWQFFVGFQAVMDAMSSNLQQIYSGGVLPEDILKAAEEAGAEVLAK